MQIEWRRNSGAKAGERRYRGEQAQVPKTIGGRANATQQEVVAEMDGHGLGIERDMTVVRI